MTAAAPQREGLRVALLRRVRGIGQDRAERLLVAFGDDLNVTLSDVVNVEAVAAVIAPDRPTLARRLAAQLVAQWQGTLRPEYEAMAWLDRHGITDKPGLAQRIVRILGKKTQATLEANPYVLAMTLPWRRMDEIGRRVLERRFGGEATVRTPQRLLGAIDSTVAECLAFGHTAVPKPRLDQFLRQRIGAAPHLLNLAVHLGEKHGRLAEAGNLWRFPGCAFLEAEVMGRIDAIARQSGRIVIDAVVADRAIAQVAPILPRPLSEEQAAAVRHALINPFAVIAGGAGTGKTATMQALVLAWEALGGRVHLCALAGKAALRLSQATHRLARTIHRTLTELSARRAAEDEGRPIKGDLAELDDATLVVVDESSMVDLGQWARLLKVMPPGCRLVMVGDTAQLPPIGFGLVFHLLAQRPDTALLTRIFRQEAESGIPVVAAAIRHRRLPKLDPFISMADGVTMSACNFEALDDRVQAVVDGIGGFGEDGLAMHVVVATNQRVAQLNRRFHDARRGTAAEVKGYLGTYFTPGDPVVHLENDYKRGLFNGMLGTVTAVDMSRRSVEVVFDGESHRFGCDELIRLDLAYALTCHKLQGSQAARVVIVLEPTRLLEPSWLYTAVTRAERQAVLVGSSELLRHTFQRQFAWQDRVVGLSG